ncbi:MAG: S8 family serine peptidase, partial [Chloroflexi bacterium]|nr:S8 family serine peptidase [Chloroflexota bacterium]
PAPTAGCNAVAGHLLVHYANRASALDRAGLRARVNGTRVRAFKLEPGLELVKTRMPVERAASLLRKQPNVAYVDLDCIVSLAQSPNDPRFSQQWGLANTGQIGPANTNPSSGTVGADIDAKSAWDIRTDASAVTVADIDTGMQLNHPDLAANLWTNPGEIAADGIDNDANGYIDDIHGWNFVDDNAIPEDDHGHGTHTAGTIGAVGNNGIGVSGVAWNVKIMPLKVFSASGQAETSDIIAALEYAVANGARISNNSYGGPVYGQAEFDAFAAAAASGHLAIAAAGNSGQNNDTHPSYPAAYGLENVVSVAATDRTDALAYFSNFGTVYVHVAAPGFDILSTVPTSMYSSGYAMASGTSMASPHVAGVAALVAAEHPTWTGAEIRDRILGTTRPVVGLVNKTWTGGVIDAGAALSLAPTNLPAVPLAPRLHLQAASDTGASSSDGVTKASTLTYDVTFNRSVTGFALADLSVTPARSGCALGALSGSGASWTVTVTGCPSGGVILAVKAGAVTDAADTTVTGPPVQMSAPPVLIDRTNPSASSLQVALRIGATLSGSAAPIRLSWQGTDGTGSGIAGYDVGRSINGGTWTALPSPVPAHLDITAATSGTVRYRVRPVDVAGNVGAWVTGSTVSPRLVQQTSTSVRFHGTWGNSTSTLYSGGSAKVGRVAGASVSFTSTGRSVSFVTTRAASRGKARIYVNGTLVATIDLGGSTAFRYVAWQRTWSVVATRTIKVVVVGTAGRPRIDVDAFAQLR